MKVILRKDYEKLGHVSEVVLVKDGYARNYLIPRGIAYEASDSNLRQLAEENKQQTRRTDKERGHAEILAGKLEKISVTIKMKVGEEEKLFGSVTAQMIADALQEKEIALDKRQIELEEPLKALGIYDVPVKLSSGVSGKVKVWIVRE
jgi:large subunit ribosomal protein L9